VLESEDILARQSDGRGWARNMIGRLCIDGAGRISEPCVRDGTSENYLAPSDHAITVRLSGADGTPCAWHFECGDDPPQSLNADCGDAVDLRVRYGRPTAVSVDVGGTEAGTHVTEEIVVRDVLIAGLGDSVAAGEGNPDRPIPLANTGFCFRQLAGSERTEYFRPVPVTAAIARAKAAAAMRSGTRSRRVGSMPPVTVRSTAIRCARRSRLRRRTRTSR
jgi:hypothetical protein